MLVIGDGMKRLEGQAALWVEHPSFPPQAPHQGTRSQREVPGFPVTGLLLVQEGLGVFCSAQVPKEGSKRSSRSGVNGDSRQDKWVQVGAMQFPAELGTNIFPFVTG